MGAARESDGWANQPVWDLDHKEKAFERGLDDEGFRCAFGIGCTELTGHGGKAQNERRAGAWLEKFCLGIPRNVATDRECAVSAPALGVHRPLRNSLSVLMREFLDQLIILQQQRTPGPRSEGILIVGNRIARARGQLIADCFRYAIGLFAYCRTPMFGLNPRCLIDQTRAALTGEIAPEPLVLHAALILQLRQKHDVKKRPDEPRNNSCEPDSA